VEDGDGCWYESTSNHPPTTFSHRFMHESPPVSGWYVQLAVRDNDCKLMWTTARIFVEEGPGGGGDPPQGEPYLEYGPTSHNFGMMDVGETDSTSFEIWNGGDKTLTYSLSGNCEWVTISQSSGESTGEHDAITVSIDTSSLTSGDHSCNINIVSNGGTGTYNVRVTIPGQLPPESKLIEITKPTERNIYFKNNKLLRSLITVVIGPITIEAEKGDVEGSIEKVEFFIDDKLKHTATVKPYSYLWNEKAFGGYTIKVKAYDNYGNVVVDQQRVSVFNFGKS
jgi:hypothetical protein